MSQTEPKGKSPKVKRENDTEWPQKTELENTTTQSQATSLNDKGDNKARKLQSEEAPLVPQKKTMTVLNGPPVQEMVGGLSVRQYLNNNLTQHLLEGLREVSKNQPEDPLRELGEFLIRRSEELKQDAEST
ncbi:hypothetical protein METBISCDRAFT_23527 [Metschnikowia bicuspidata]|uniref:Uncharacterized protein n=1 Tax=Metschnikowia bicuspidata TaxID=27322 RepID=A0A4V1J2Z2_9ASCO|nr:hypothetical protein METBISCDRAFT_23527 [Metschnikowia bicuspidata]